MKSREAKRAYDRARYARVGRTEWYERRQHNSRIIRHRNEQYIRGVKVERGCAECGFRSHPEVLEFDHVRGEKGFELSRPGTRALASIDAEIAKCEVRCANCHRIKTAERRCEAIEW